MSTKRSIIKDSTKIRKSLQERFSELKISRKQIVEDAAGRGMVFNNASLSKYLNYGNVACTLSEENIIWLCIRYGIPITLCIGKPKLENKGIAFVVPQYNEEDCLKNLKKVFDGKAK